jgi:hypothetical protein
MSEVIGGEAGISTAESADALAAPFLFADTGVEANGGRADDDEDEADLDLDDEEYDEADDFFEEDDDDDEEYEDDEEDE